MGAKIKKVKILPVQKDQPELKLVKNPYTGDKELWVRILGNTVPEQFSQDYYEGWRLWAQIRHKQRELKGYKNIRSIDLELYNLHVDMGYSYKRLIQYAKKKWDYVVKSPEDMAKKIYRINKLFERIKIMDKKRKKN